MKYFYLFFLFPLCLFAQEVTVDINSGNPAFPFPQFLAYESDNHSLGNLATQNAPGVTHAEMEQVIRDAWQIMANRFTYEGINIGEETIHDGVRYIKGNVGCPYDCSEGDGYALLAAAEMADKTTFDGLWFRAHDFRMIAQPRYEDGEIKRPDYPYGRFALMDNNDSAADGDFDIALALLIASKQWGENSGHVDFSNNIINYRQEALNVIRGIVERAEGDNIGDRFFTSGSIGFDGYIKGGNTWNELTTWAADEAAADVNLAGPQFSGQGVPISSDDEEGGGTTIDQGAQGIVGTVQHIDYAAPAYFHAFAEFLEEEGDIQDLDWNISQYRRAEGSSDWLMGRMLDDTATLPLAGWVGLTADNDPIYFNFLDGEDFRNPWRTILNYVWHGDAETTWNPDTHQLESGGNSYEREIGERLADFLANPGSAPWNNDCDTPGNGLSYNGPSQLKQFYDPITGEELGAFPLNWLSGTGSPAAVAAQDFDLMGKLYRQCVIEWDTTVAGDGYITSVPGYFHGFFRLLGMLTLSGNHHSPAEIELESNMKVYHSVDKTFAFTGDELEYTISYRNYASVDAENVTISTTLPEGLSFVSSEGGVNSGGVVSWKIGEVAGFKTEAGVAGSSGNVTMKVMVDPSFSGRICNSFEIITSNGKGWVSNEFPNEESDVMQRNCVDIVEKALEITKEANFEEVNPGDVVTYQVDFENASSGGFINGGRPGVIIGYAHGGHEAVSSSQQIMIRLYHDAAEPYVNYGNYRISLFLNDNSTNCISGEPGCDDGVGWVVPNQIYEGGNVEDVTISSESIVPGSDERGNYNQRVIIRFADQLATTTPHLARYFGGVGGRIHQGGGEPLRARWDLHNSEFSEVNWRDDWSWNPGASDDGEGAFFPVTNDFTDINNPDIPVNIYHGEACETPNFAVDNILVEEWDGFTWRRAYGNSPLPGRETNNVIVKDVLPEGFTFVGFVDERGVDLGNSIDILGEPVTYDEATRTITWTKSILQVREGGGFRYQAIADFSSGECTRADEEQINVASIEAQNESPVIAEATVNLTCDPVILPPAESSMVKEVSPISAEVGENVEYTLSYKNTDGSPFQSDFSESWTVREGADFSIDGTGVSNISTNNPNVITNDFSHGQDGIIEATVQFDDNAQFGFALRYTGDLTASGIGNGYYLVFKPNSGSGNVETSLYNGVTQVGTSDTSSLKISTSLITDIKIELIGEQINIWMGNISSPIPSLTLNGIEERVGYTGVINGTPTGQDSFGTHKLTSFYSEMDSAFNLQIVDPVPGELSFISSEEGELIGGEVVFPIQAGPVLADEEFVYSWTAEIISCPADTDSKIDNIAFTNIFGIPENTIAAQAILDCSGVDLCGDDPAAVGLLNEENELVFMLNDPTIDIEDIIIVSEDHEIIWFDGPSKFDDEINTPVIDTSEEIEITYYVAQQLNTICGEGERIPITVIVNSMTDVEPCSAEIPVVTNVDYCLNQDVTDTLGSLITAEGTIVWYSSETSETAISEPTIDTSVSGETTYFVSQIIDDCESERAEITVNVLEGSDEEVLHNEVIFSNEALDFDILSETNLDVDGFTWSASSSFSITGQTIAASTESSITDTLINSAIIDQEIVYTIIPNDCNEATHILTVTVRTLPSVEIRVSNVVEGDDLEIEFIFSKPTVSETIIVLGLTPGAENGVSSDDINLDDINVVIPAGVAEYDFKIETIDDEILEETEDLEITIENVENDNLAPFSEIIEVSIFDNEGLPNIIIDPIEILEGETKEIDIRLSHPSSENITLTISLVFENDTTSDRDFQLLNGDAITVSFAAGQVEPISSTSVTAVDDTIPEGNQELFVSVESTENDIDEIGDITDDAIITIIDDDLAPTIVLDVDSVIEGEIAEVPIFLRTEALDRIELEIGFRDITTNGDFDATSQIVVFEAGSITPNSPLRIETLEDSIEENDEEFEVFIASIITGTVSSQNFIERIDTAIVTIQDDDRTLRAECTSLIAPLNGSTDVSINLTSIVWEQMLDVTGYELTIGTTSGGNDLADDTITDNFYTIPDTLEENQTYFVNVVPFNGSGRAISCSEFSFTTGDIESSTIPDCPSIISPSSSEVDVELSPFIRWDSVDNADGYFISIGTSAVENDIVDNLDVSDNLSYLVSTDLDEETTYYVTVFPYNTEGTNDTCQAQFFVTRLLDIDRTKYGLSPNGDGVNEFWEIDDIEDFPDNEVLIYNRWGDLVYRTLNYDNNFNVFKGEANQQTNIGAGTLVTGTYFYEIRIEGEHNFPNLKGFLVLKR